jgi:hypothetical protein
MAPNDQKERFYFDFQKTTIVNDQRWSLKENYAFDYKDIKVVVW